MKTSPIYLIAVLFLGFSCKTVNKTSQKPNILFLFTDDYTYRAVHALGNKQVISPNIDQLIANGTTLTHAYNMGSWSGAVCTASRSMLVSGMSVWRANANREKWNNNDSTAKANTWPKLMEQAGYETYMSGKWHVDIPAESVFNHTTHIRHGMPEDAFDHAKMMNLFNTEVASGRKTFVEVMPNGYNRPLSSDDKSWSPTDTSKGGYWKGGKHWSEVLKDDAIGFIDAVAKKDEPFFMYLAFNAAHDPRQSPQKYIDMYPLDKIELPENFQADYPYHDEIGVGPKLRDEALAPFPRTELAIKTHLQEYYAIITHMDEQIGLILKELEAKGLRENTFIFMTADHGLAMGRHGLLGKQNMYDHSMRVPLLVAGPGVPKGKKIDNDVFLQDIMASSIEAAGIKKPDFVEFNSFLPLVKNIENKEYLKNGVYGAYLDLQRMIRKDGYKLIVYPVANKVLLFDMTKDPEEMTNLADNAQFKDKKKVLFEDLLKLQKHYSDTLDLSKFGY